MNDSHKKIRNVFMDEVKTNRSLKSDELKVEETEGLIIAAKDFCLPTRNYQANMIKIDPTQYVDCAD